MWFKLNKIKTKLKIILTVENPSNAPQTPAPNNVYISPVREKSLCDEWELNRIELMTDWLIFFLTKLELF